MNKMRSFLLCDAAAKNLLWLSVLLVTFLAVSHPVASQSQPSSSVACTADSDASCVDWSAGTAMATGVGTPANWANTPRKKRLSATRAAKLNAAHVLLELLQGINLDADDELGTRLEAAKKINASLQGRLKNLQPIRGPEYLEDGSVRIRLATSLHEVLPRRWLTAEAPAPFSPGSGLLPTYSGLILDARGLNAAPALAPRLLDPAGMPAYTTGYVDRRYLLSQGAVGYLRSLKEAQNHPRVGNNPLILKPQGVSGPRQVDFVLSQKNADLLRRLHRRQDFLSQSRVLIVLDGS